MNIDPLFKVISILTLVLLLSSCGLKPLPESDPVTMGKEAMEPSKIPPYKLPDHVQQALLPKTRFVKNSYSKKRFDIKANASPVGAFFSSISVASGINVVVDPNITGTVTLNMQDVTVDEILRALRDTYGYDFRPTAYGYRVNAKSLQSRIFSLDYLKVKREGTAEIKISGNGLVDVDSDDDSDSQSVSSEAAQIVTTSTSDFWENIKSLLTEMVGNEQGRQVIIDANAGIIMVKAFPNEIVAIEEFLNTVQQSVQRQVVIEAKILEVQLDDGYEQGINWDTFGAGVGADATFSNSGRPFAIDIAEDSTNTHPNDGLYGIGGIFSMSFNYKNDFAGAIKLLQTQGDVKVLSSPRISTVNNQKAVIKVGIDEYFVTDVSSTTTATSNTTNQTPEVTLTPFFSGIALDVTPQIGANDNITLHVHPSVTEVITQNKNLSIFGETLSLPLALSSVRESDSIIRAKDNQVVVMGGLLSNRTTDYEARVPVLSSLPVIGELFVQKKQIYEKIELVILLKPMIMEQPEWNQALEDLRENFPYWQSGRADHDNEYMFKIN